MHLSSARLTRRRQRLSTVVRDGCCVCGGATSKKVTSNDATAGITLGSILFQEVLISRLELVCDEILRWRLLREQLTQQRQSCQSGGGIESSLIVVISVIEPTTDRGSDDPGHAPGREQQPVVDPCVLRTPEIRSGGAVDGELRAVTPGKVLRSSSRCDRVSSLLIF